MRNSPGLHVRSRRRAWLRLALAATLGLALAAGPAGAATLDTLTITVGSSPGGGWDQTARAMQSALQSAGIVRTVRVENVPGGTGTIALAQISRKKGDPTALLVSGLAMVTGILQTGSPVTLKDVTPLARLTSEWQVLAVPASSDIKTVQDLVKRFKENPGAVSWGGGAAGSADHVTVGLFARAVGVDPTRINYVAHSGGGEAAASLLGSHVTVGVSGLGEFEQQAKAGHLRILAVAAPNRLPGVDAPTLKESGVDLEHGNWRSIMAAPGLSDADRARLLEAIDRMVKSEPWKRTLADRGWTDAYLAGDQFAAFLAEEQARVEATMRSLGLVK